MAVGYKIPGLLGQSTESLADVCCLKSRRFSNLPCCFLSLQGSVDSTYSQPSSDLSLDEEKDKEALRRETERQAVNQLEKAKVNPSCCQI